MNYSVLMDNYFPVTKLWRKSDWLWTSSHDDFPSDKKCWNFIILIYGLLGWCSFVWMVSFNITIICFFKQTTKFIHFLFYYLVPQIVLSTSCWCVRARDVTKSYIYKECKQGWRCWRKFDHCHEKMCPLYAFKFPIILTNMTCFECFTLSGVWFLAYFWHAKCSCWSEQHKSLMLWNCEWIIMDRKRIHGAEDSRTGQTAQVWEP